MDLRRKIEILTAGAKYDASCASSGSTRPGAGGREQRAPGCCHSWSADGRCVSLLKILMTNLCVYDCAYCVNRRSSDTPRALLTPDEIAGLTMDFYRRNYIEGLFLSSGVARSPDYTMELMIGAARKLRVDHKFPGYIHLKVIPGCDRRLVDLAALYADRVSVNIELPSAASLERLAPEKSRDGVLKPMAQLADSIAAGKEERRKSHKAPPCAPGGQSTQLIVGASPETDLQIMKLSQSLYEKLGLKRVYYSAFVPATTDSRLPAVKGPPLRREHRLYQADWLLRFYGFSTDELLDEKCPCLDLTFDPKTVWALRNLDRFPVEVNKAPYEELLRVPGFGVLTAKRIVRARRAGGLRLEDLSRLGAVMKRAVYFVTAGGIYGGLRRDDPAAIRAKLLEGPSGKPAQPELFGPAPETAAAGAPA